MSWFKKRQAETTEQQVVVVARALPFAVDRLTGASVPSAALPDRDDLVPELASLGLLADSEQDADEFYSQALAELRERAGSGVHAPGDHAWAAAHGVNGLADLLPAEGAEGEWLLSVRARTAAYDFDRATIDALTYDDPDLPEQKRDQLIDRHDRRLDKFGRLKEARDALTAAHAKVADAHRALAAAEADAAAHPEDEKKKAALEGARERVPLLEDAIGMRVERVKSLVVQVEELAAGQHELALEASQSRRNRRHAEAEARIAAMSGQQPADGTTT